jgi:DNA ligase 1
MEASSIGAGGMSLFAKLVIRLGNSTKTNEKLGALSEYFSVAEEKDKVWVIAIFSGRRPKRAVSNAQLQGWCIELTRLPDWLFEECYQTVGDLAETIALLLSEKPVSNQSDPLFHYLEGLISIEKEDESFRKQFIVEAWKKMDQGERFVFNKLITGAFRIGVSQATMVNALARSTGLEPSVIAHRISGNWDPTTATLEGLLNDQGSTVDHSRPYPFYLSYPLEEDFGLLGDTKEWIAEWKWDGIRGQVIRRDRRVFVWSRGEELITEKFPEYQAWQELLPEGTVLDGEIIGLSAKDPRDRNIQPLPFAALQTRISRKNITKKSLLETPVGFIAYDLLEYEAMDWRSKPLFERKEKLAQVIETIHHPGVLLSPILEFKNWDELANIRSHARSMGAEGLMLKRKNSLYQAGRKRGDWWKWKIDPLVIDAVLVYAQKGHGRRSNLYTDYTFAVKDGEKLVTFAKAYSGLTDQELEEVDFYVKRNSIEKFGPVRTVKPELVFEIAFEGIAASSRHKSGIAVRFPRISRWRKDKKPAEINTLEDLKKLLDTYGK